MRRSLAPAVSLALLPLLVSCAGAGAGSSSTTPLVVSTAPTTPTSSSVAKRNVSKLVAADAASGPTIVQSALAAPDSSATTSVTVTLPAAPAAGDLLVFGTWSAASKPTVTGPSGVTSAGAVSYAAGQGQSSVWFRYAAAGDPQSYTFTSNAAAAMGVGVVELAGALNSGTPGTATLLGRSATTTGWAVSASADQNLELPVAMYFASTGGTAWTLGTLGAGTPSTDQQISSETNVSAAIVHANGTSGTGSNTWWGSATASQPATGSVMALLIRAAATPAPTPTPPAVSPSPAASSSPAASPSPAASSSPTASPSPAGSPTPTPAPVVDSTASPLYLNEQASGVVGDTSVFGTIVGAPGTAPIDGLICATSGAVKTHYHAHFSLFVNAHQYALPSGTGINYPAVQYSPYFVQNTPSEAGSCYYEIHVHALMGVVHIELGTTNGTATLGQFLDIWGQQLSASGFGPFSGPTRWFETDESSGNAGQHVVQEDTGTDPHLINMVDHHEYTVEVGPKWVPITNLSWGPNVP